MKFELPKQLFFTENILYGRDRRPFFTLKNRVLFAVYFDEKCKVGASELVRNLGIFKTNLALLCHKMQKEGLLKREKVRADGRVVFWQLTEAGRTEAEKQLQGLEKTLANCQNLSEPLQKIIKIAEEGR